MADKNIFEFDTAPFERGLNKISKGMAGLQKGAGNMARSVARGVTAAVAKIGVLALAFKGVNSAIKEMPEIGKAFNIAKDVIMKNLLFPLRKAVFPLLQRFLNWVRDNRAMFVRWGQTIANIFTTIVDSIGEVIKIGQKMFQSFLGFVNKIFGSNIRDLQDLLNILSFKFAVVFEFMKALISPLQSLFEIIFKIGYELVKNVLDTIFKIGAEFIKVTKEGNNIFTVIEKVVGLLGDAFLWASKMAKAFAEGFAPFIGPVLDSMSKIADYFKSIFDSIFGSNEAMSGWESLFKFIGEVLGTTVLATFKVFEDIIKGIDATIKTIKGIIDFFSGKDVGEDFGKNAFDAIMGIFSLMNPALNAQMQALKTQGMVDDAIVTNDGKVIPINNQDDIIAYKPGGPIEGAFKGRGINVNIDFKGMQIVLQQATPEEAQKFSESLVDNFRATLTRELERGGIF